MQIYIQPKLEARLRQETNMSGLINSLLIKHYTSKVMSKKLENDSKYGDGLGEPIEYVKVSETVIPRNIDKTYQEPDILLVPPVAKNIPKESNGICKIHATPLDKRNKCLQKDCKYA